MVPQNMLSLMMILKIRMIQADPSMKESGPFYGLAYLAQDTATDLHCLVSEAAYLCSSTALWSYAAYA